MNAMANETILLRCAEDGEPLSIVSTPERGVLAVCLVCGAAGDYEEVAQQSAGLIQGLFPEEELVRLRAQARISKDGS